MPAHSFHRAGSSWDCRCAERGVARMACATFCSARSASDSDGERLARGQLFNSSRRPSRVGSCDDPGSLESVTALCSSGGSSESCDSMAWREAPASAPEGGSDEGCEGEAGSTCVPPLSRASSCVARQRLPSASEVVGSAWTLLWSAWRLRTAPGSSCSNVALVRVVMLSSALGVALAVAVDGSRGDTASFGAGDLIGASISTPVGCGARAAFGAGVAFSIRATFGAAAAFGFGAFSGVGTAFGGAAGFGNGAAFGTVVGAKGAADERASAVALASTEGAVVLLVTPAHGDGFSVRADGFAARDDGFTSSDGFSARDNRFTSADDLSICGASSQSSSVYACTAARDNGGRRADSDPGGGAGMGTDTGKVAAATGPGAQLLTFIWRSADDIDIGRCLFVFGKSSNS